MHFRLFFTLFSLNLICLWAGFSLKSGGDDEVTTTFSVIAYLISATVVSIALSLSIQKLSDLYRNWAAVYLITASFLVMVVSSGIIYFKIIMVQPMSLVLSMVMLVMVYIGQFLSIGLVYIPLMSLCGLIVAYINRRSQVGN